jgi:signal transduction histidine kinase
VADYEKIHHIAIDVTLDELDTIDLPPAVELGVYRILQEALTNVARHSGAKTVRIVFARSPRALQATVTDDGCGFEADPENAISRSHLGLQSIRERAAMLGGTVSFTSNATGTTILLHIPLVQPDSRWSPGRRVGDNA